MINPPNHLSNISPCVAPTTQGNFCPQPKRGMRNSVRNLMCVGRYAEKMQWSEAKWNLFEMPAIDMSILCIPAECDNIKLPIDGEIASRWDAYLLCDICRHFASVMLHFASLISHNLRCIPAYAHLIPTGFFQSLLNNHRDNLHIIAINFKSWLNAPF